MPRPDRVLLVLLAVLILPAGALAQQLGVKAGINLASLPPEEDEHPDIPPRFGPVGGIWAGMPAAGRYSFQAEALFSEKGVHWDFSPELSVEIRIRYLEVPLLARIDFSPPASTRRVFVVAGGAPAFELSARSTTKFEGEVRSRDVDRQVETVDLGLVGGAGVEFGRGLIEARYTHGLLRVNTDDNEPNDRLNNRVFSVMVGFRFR